MDKARRNELATLKHKRRCKIIGVDPKNHYQFKAQGKPCSCFSCSPMKYSRKQKHKPYSEY